MPSHAGAVELPVNDDPHPTAGAEREVAHVSNFKNLNTEFCL